MYIQFFITLALFSVSINAFEPPYRPCESTTQSSKLHSLVAYDNANETSWIAQPGKTMKADLIFTPMEDIKRTEFTIYAILDPKGGPGGKPLEINYGRPLNACQNLNVTSCETEGIKAHKPTKIQLIFDVPATVPKISLDVRFILREAVSKKLTRLQKTDWKKHPGRMILCSILPTQVV